MAKKMTVKRAGRDSDQFMVRLPDGMRKHLAELAARNGRSMNAEVVTALTMYFASEHSSPLSIGYRLPADIKAALDDLRDKLAGQDRKLTELLIKQTTK